MRKKVTAPRNTVIKGQPHQLAYINDQEQGLLMALGGAGVPVHGVPAYYSDDDDAFEGAAMADFESTYSGGDDSDAYADTPKLDDLMAGAAARNAINAANRDLAAKAAAAPQVAQASGDRYTARQADLDRQIAQSYFDYADVFAPSVYSSRSVGQDLSRLFDLNTYKNALAGKGFNLGGVPLYSSFFDDKGVRNQFNNMAIDQIKGRNYGDGRFDKLVGAASGYFNNKIIDAINSGGRAVLDANGKVVGAFSQGPFGLGEVYTGMPVEGLPETGWNAGGPEADTPTKPVNELTGTCEEGYVYDEDLKACRLDTGAKNGAAGGGNFGVSGETYYRPNALDTAPANIPAYMGPNYNYHQANKNFVQTYAYNPDYYENQMDITGFAPVSGILV